MMANIYVDSAGSNTSPYDTWAKAATTLAAAATYDATTSTGNNIWVKQSHNETATAGVITLDWDGTAATPTRVICVSDSNEPPTTMAVMTNWIATSNASAITPANSGFVYFYGIKFEVDTSASGAAAADIAFNNGNDIVYESCSFKISNTNSGSDFQIATAAHQTFVNCTFTASNTGSALAGGSGTITRIIGGSWSGGTYPTGRWYFCGNGDNVLIDGFDFSGMGATIDIFGVGQAGRYEVRNCKAPGSWSGSVFESTTVPADATFRMWNTGPSATAIQYQKMVQFGEINATTSVYRTAGASDGTSNFSWKCDTYANAEWLHQTLDTDEIVRWNESTSQITVTVEILIDSATTLTNQDVWMEVMYMGTSGNPLAVFDKDSRATDYLASSSTLTSGTGLANWTGDGGTGNSYKLVSTFTPTDAGFIHAKVRIAKASLTTLYVDPKLDIA